MNEVINAGGSLLTEPAEHWFCVRTQLKREHIAAANLRRFSRIEVFNPQIKSRKATRRGFVWSTESLFPNYIFARFAFDALAETVNHTEGVGSLVRFGNRTPAIPDFVIEHLMEEFGSKELRVLPDPLKLGDSVLVVGGALAGFKGIVLGLLPARDRVRVLLEILGRSTPTEIGREAIVPEESTCRAIAL